MKISDFINQMFLIPQTTEQSLARKYNTSHSYISYLKNGRYDNPSITEATNICKKLNWDINTFKTYVPNKDDEYYSSIEERLSSNTNDKQVAKMIEQYFDRSVKVETLEPVKISKRCSINRYLVDLTNIFYYLKAKRLSKYPEYKDDNIRDFNNILIDIIRNSYGNHIIMTDSLCLYDEIISLYSNNGRIPLFSKDKDIILYYNCKNRSMKKKFVIVQKI